MVANIGFINVLNFPHGLLEFWETMEKEGINVLKILNNEIVEWICPEDVLTNELCFWALSEYAIDDINNVEKILKRKPYHMQYDYLMNCIEQTKELCNKFGGKIFAVGRVVGSVVLEDGEDKSKNNIFCKQKTIAPIYTFYHLKNPLELNRFDNSKNTIIELSQNQCEELLNAIEKADGVTIPLVDKKNGVR